MVDRVRINEVWKKIPGIPLFYEVSDSGRVRSLSRLKNSTKTSGRGAIVPLKEKILRIKGGNICLYWEGHSHWYKIAQLVLRAFIGPSPAGKYLARHLDDNPDNNQLGNLAWGNHQDNYDDGVRNGRHGAGTPGAVIRSLRLKDRPRPIEVRRKISKTKQLYPERQHYGRRHGPDGRFIP